MIKDGSDDYGNGSDATAEADKLFIYLFIFPIEGVERGSVKKEAQKYMQQAHTIYAYAYVKSEP